MQSHGVLHLHQHVLSLVRTFKSKWFQCYYFGINYSLFTLISIYLDAPWLYHAFIRLFNHLIWANQDDSTYPFNHIWHILFLGNKHSYVHPIYKNYIMLFGRSHNPPKLFAKLVQVEQVQLIELLVLPSSASPSPINAKQHPNLL